ncbi:MAG: asparagine synthase C-terminal domain-containing protein, partial [Gemmatimonadota bacterium]|nr:asparagine synthase C-terminal domain-containing protein [Gemmatimonadota bacterium]
PAPINALLIAERAREDGLKVLLSGAGGDDIFSGYRRHVALTHEGLWAWLPPTPRRGVATIARALASGSGPGGLRTPWLRRVTKSLCYADYPTDRRLASYFWWSTEQLRRGLYGPALAGPLGEVDTAGPLVESLARIPDEPDPLNRLLYLEGKHFLADHNLNYTDKMGMAAGVEVRVPLLDLDLIAMATRIPTGMKQRGREGKAIFKRSMEGLLPREVIYRGKTGFGAPIRRWLTVELRSMVEDTLAPGVLRRRGLFAPDAVARLIALDRAGRVDGAYTIFALMSLELWCRQFLDQPLSAEAVNL